MPYVTPAAPGVEVTSSKVIYEELRILTIDTGYARPGAIVVRDTNDQHCKVAASGDAGLFGFIAPNPQLDDDTDFTTEDCVRIGHGQGAVVALPFDHTGAGHAGVTKGDALYVGNHGKVTKAAGTDITKIIGWAEETKAIDGLLLTRLAK